MTSKTKTSARRKTICRLVRRIEDLACQVEIAAHAA
jgi:hypothetical protein